MKKKYILLDLNIENLHWYSANTVNLFVKMDVTSYYFDASHINVNFNIMVVLRKQALFVPRLVERIKQIYYLHRWRTCDHNVL